MYARFIIWINIALIGYGAFAAPPVINDLLYHLDAKDIHNNGTLPNDGDAISNWVNKAATGNATLMSGSIPPTYDADGFSTTNHCGAGVRFGETGESVLLTPDIFGGSVSELTLFIVSREIIRRPNFTLSLNGFAYPSSTANLTNSRLSFHLPWSNNNSYFDFNGCCNSNTGRVFGTNPAALGAVLYTTAYQSQTAQKTGLRGNGALIDENNYGTIGATQNGIALGSVTSRYYNGLIGELLIYDRYLSASEITQTEEYLRNKWIDCLTDLQITKEANVTIIDEKAMFSYTITILNNGPNDASNVTVTDTLPNGISLHNAVPSQGSVTP